MGFDNCLLSSGVRVTVRQTSDFFFIWEGFLFLYRISLFPLPSGYIVDVVCGTQIYFPTSSSRNKIGKYGKKILKCVAWCFHGFVYPVGLNSINFVVFRGFKVINHEKAEVVSFGSQTD